MPNLVEGSDYDFHMKSRKMTTTVGCKVSEYDSKTCRYQDSSMLEDRTVLQVEGNAVTSEGAGKEEARSGPSVAVHDRVVNKIFLAIRSYGSADINNLTYSGGS